MLCTNSDKGCPSGRRRAWATLLLVESRDRKSVKKSQKKVQNLMHNYVEFSKQINFNSVRNYFEKTEKHIVIY